MWFLPSVFSSCTVAFGASIVVVVDSGVGTGVGVGAGAGVDDTCMSISGIELTD